MTRKIQEDLTRRKIATPREKIRLVDATELLMRKAKQVTRESQYKEIELTYRHKTAIDTRMNQLSALFRALKQTELEKVDSIVTKSRTGFYPNQGRLKSSKKQTIALSVNPTDNLTKNTFKTDYHNFDHRTVDDLIE